MKYSLQFRKYKRILKIPLVSSKVTMRERMGIIIRLEDEERNIGFGEVAPLENFGSESLEDAEKLLKNFKDEIDQKSISSIDGIFSCTRYALEAAQMFLEKKFDAKKMVLEVAAIITNDKNALRKMQNLIKKGYKTFKFKIGILGFNEEKERMKLLYDHLPEGGKIRLDANGTLTTKNAQKWLAFLDTLEVQFLEQPLAKGEEVEMMQLKADFKTPIALDESIVGIGAMAQIVNEGWDSFLIVKPSLIRSIVEFLKWRQECACPIIYSSALETDIGMHMNFQIAASDKKNRFALGFGLGYFFNKKDGLNSSLEAPKVDQYSFNSKKFEEVWANCE